MTDHPAYTPADTLRPGDLLLDDDGFLSRVVAVEGSGTRVRLTLVPEHGCATWPAGERRSLTLGRRRMVRVPAAGGDTELPY